MSKPPNFSGYTPERMKDLLQAEERRRNAVSDWKLMAHTWGTVAIVVLVIGLVVAVIVR